MCTSILRQLARRQEALRRRLSRAEEEADRLSMDLMDLAAAREERADAADDRGLPKRRRASRETRDALRRTADAGAARLVISERSDGSADVQVDDGTPFTLSPALADLLSILAAKHEPESADGLAGWTPLEEIARRLEKRSGRRITAHAVTQQIHRLRRELFERGAVNPWLVQTNRRSGARFALRVRG